MFSRYNKIGNLVNNSSEYDDIRLKKGLTFLTQKKFFDFSRLQSINLENFEYITHIFSENERLYNISTKYYGSPEYGWLILYLNRISSELKIRNGDILKIYFPKEFFLDFIRD